MYLELYFKTCKGSSNKNQSGEPLAAPGWMTFETLLCYEGSYCMPRVARYSKLVKSRPNLAQSRSRGLKLPSRASHFIQNHVPVGWGVSLQLAVQQNNPQQQSIPQFYGKTVNLATLVTSVKYAGASPFSDLKTGSNTLKSIL